MTVSLCVVAYNEEKYLLNLINDLRSQTYPHKDIEIILIDSASTDNTKKLMLEFAESPHDFLDVRVYDNPKKVQACGWNIAVKNSNCDVIVRIDAHTHIPSEFTALNVKNLESGEYVSGGIRPCIIENETAWGITLLHVENSLFGSSINKCRRSKEKTYVKTMFHAAYMREVFAKVGGFNENLLRTEDNEMHYRIRNAGYKLSFEPQIISYQYARNSLKKMIRQKYGNGKWIGLTLGVTPQCISLFHLVPFCFLMAVVFCCVLACLGFWQFAVLLFGMYSAFAIVNTVLSIKNDGFYIYKLIMPILFLVLHISYGLGSFVGICLMPFMAGKLKKCPTISEVKEELNRKTLLNNKDLDG